MPPTFILAHDLGTTGNKATLFDASGAARASVFYGYSASYPRPNWAEQNPEDWWQAVCTTTRRLLSEANINPAEVACVCFSGQMQGCLPVDRQAAPLRSAIIWADTRAVDETNAFVEKVSLERIYAITGHRPSPAYTAEKMLWLRTHQPEIFARAAKFLGAKDFIIARLTGRFVTDYSDASGTNLDDLVGHVWSAELLEAAGLAPGLLPELHASSDVAGEVTPEAAVACGLRPGTPVVIGGGDGACATAGAGVVSGGSAYTYIGSSAWIGTATRQPVFDPRMRTMTFAALDPALYCPIGAMQTAGGAYQWLRDTLCLPEKEAAARLNTSPYALMDELARQSPPGAGGLLFLPYLLGERSPRWNPQARGAFFGLSMAHTRADLVRATLEGIGLNLRVILEAFQQQGAGIRAMRLIGGGANGDVWRQILADIFGLPVQRPALVAEATSLGAALAGGIGVGLFKDYSLSATLTPLVDESLPDLSLQPRYARSYELFNKVYEAFLPLYEAMAEEN